MSLRLKYDKHGNAVGACPLEGGIVRCPFAVADCSDCKIDAGGETSKGNANQSVFIRSPLAPTPPTCGEDCPIEYGAGCEVCPHYPQKEHTHNTLT
jgi:hypothetical protein